LLYSPGRPLATWAIVAAAEAPPGEPAPLAADPHIVAWLQGDVHVDCGARRRDARAAAPRSPRRLAGRRGRRVAPGRAAARRGGTRARGRAAGQRPPGLRGRGGRAAWHAHLRRRQSGDPRRGLADRVGARAAPRDPIARRPRLAWWRARAALAGARRRGTRSA